LADPALAGAGFRGEVRGTAQRAAHESASVRTRGRLRVWLPSVGRRCVLARCALHLSKHGAELFRTLSQPPGKYQRRTCSPAGRKTEKRFRKKRSGRQLEKKEFLSFALFPPLAICTKRSCEVVVTLRYSARNAP
jgi:hypothetical protein